jgi:Ser/Thr protein kinase RdoA (MazF antagonist)
VDGPGNYWFCRRFIKHRQADWSSNTLIERAAVTLADVHRAEVKPWLPAHEFYHFVADRLDPYYWSVLEILNRFGDLVARLHESHMSPDEAIEVMHLAKELPAEARDIDLGPVGLTHADYRPENILVSRRGRILEVIDWDRARPDHQLFDAVVAGLQFAKWNSQRGRNDLQVAHRFVDVYRDACGIDVDAAAVRWMFRFTFVKALLLSRNPGLWLPLFRAYTDTDRSISIPVGSAPVLTY